MKRLYTVSPPIDLRGALMSGGDFFVPMSHDGVKLASWLDDATAEQKEELFKVAIEKDTRNLAKAYNEMCNAGEKVEDVVETVVDDDDDDDYGQNVFYEGDEDSEAEDDEA